MDRRPLFRYAAVRVCLAVLVIGVAAGTNCPFGFTPPAGSPIVSGNQPPRIVITGVQTLSGDNFAEVGEEVIITFIGEDAEDASVARVFASTSGNPTPAQEIPILGGFPVGPGTASGLATWNTTGLPPGAYNIFAEIDDRTFDPFTGTGNPPVRVTTSQLLQLGAPGSRPATSSPRLVFLSPMVNLGLSAQDELTLRYIYSDVDSTATVTLLLDKDLNPNNDDINNPGDPLDPNTNIIILPSAPRQPDDPTFDGDPPPPDDPMDPPVQPDSLEIRTNPRTLPQTVPGLFPFPGAPLAGSQIDYIFQIDFTEIPPRSQPYFVRAVITDGNNTRNVYAVGSLTIASAAVGTIDCNTIGFGTSGARFLGFAARENLGTSFLNVGDIDRDGVGEYMIVGRYASPRNRPEVGAGYMIFGRPKLPFPADTDDDGLPDGGAMDQDGNIINFPEPPDFVLNPYEPTNVGRFGGEISINSVGSFFRGTIYAMAAPLESDPPPPALLDPNNPNRATAGLTSATRVELTGDEFPDFIFGTPYIATILDFLDDDPSDGACNINFYPDFLSNDRCTDNTTGDTNDDVTGSFVTGSFGSFKLNQGFVFMVDGSSDLQTQFIRFIDVGIAGQFDPANNRPFDFEGVLRSDDEIPEGVRIRGAFFDPLWRCLFGENSTSEYGRTVASLPDITGDQRPELMVSAPGLIECELVEDPSPMCVCETEPTGAVDVWLSGIYTADIYLGSGGSDGVRSFPAFDTIGNSCFGEDEDSQCIRGLQTIPVSSRILGEQPGDRFGNADSGGDVNLDGLEDVLAGAPTADRVVNGNSLVDNGVFYLLFVNAAGFGPIDLEVNPPPFVKITGTHNGDMFGRTQTGVQDMNGDGNPDAAFGSDLYDDDVAGVDAGYVGVLFGNPNLTGENGFLPEEVGTPIAPGVRFRAVSAGANLGRGVASAGDFNGDGFGDLLITSPGETRIVNGQLRQGVAYLIFGGPHLDPSATGRNPNIFNLNEVGQPQLPGIIFISRVLLGTGPETLAPIEFVGGLGDIDGDGFDDIGLGAPTADFVNLVSPNQRRVDSGEVYIVYGNNFGSNNINP